MFDHLFENRNTTVTNLIKLGDCLGRSLRENLEIFSIDSETKNVAYLTESGRVIRGKYTFGSDIVLEDVKIQDSDIFTDNKTFDSHVNEKVSYFVGELNSNNYNEADTDFNGILSLWENRLKFESVKKRLEEKASVFSDNQTIINTPEFQRFIEVAPQFTEFLTENKDTITNVKEIENAIKLSNSVSTAFNFPKISYEKLEEDKSYTISRGVEKSVYELICKQELVKKELLESKKGFEDVWATHSSMRNVASHIFNGDDDVILESLITAIMDIPYLALTTKKQLFESVSNSMSIGDASPISTKEVKTYVSKLFEMKKPLKQIVINLLNEKYGINVQNLKETATFESLANTQMVIFEALSRLAPKGTVIKENLSELSSMLKKKNGVEVIDVNEILQGCFEACGYDIFCNDFTLVEEFTFDQILSESSNFAELLEKTQAKLLLDKKKKKKKKKGSDEEDENGEENGEENGDENGDEKFTANKKDHLSPEQAKKDKETEGHEKTEPACHNDHEDDAIRARENKGQYVKEGAEGAEAPEATEAPQMDQPDQEEAPMEAPPITKEDFLKTLEDMSDLLKGNLSMDDDETEAEEAEE